MKAMILAAGLGTRLRPLTDSRPKALVEVAGRTLLEIALERLQECGVSEVIVNVHHFADMVVDYLEAQKNFGMRIEISREKELLDTGGGLKKAAWFFMEESTQPEPFILHNVDVLSTINLRKMVQAHEEQKNLTTLAVQRRESSRQLLFDAQLILCGRKRNEEIEIARKAPHQPRRFAFTGIHVISPRLLTMMNEDGAFSIIDTYLRLAGQGEKIVGFPADEYEWRDVGRLDDLRQAAEGLKRQKIQLNIREALD
jgi:NDP-sugar pyrophosphorylase family protein